MFIMSIYTGRVLFFFKKIQKILTMLDKNKLI